MTAFFDRRSWLPVELRRTSTMGEESWALGDYRDEQVLVLPHSWRHTGSGVADEWHAREVGLLDRSVRAQLVRPSNEPGDTALDPDRVGPLTVARARTGHVLVHPLVNGEDLAPFLFDTGAGVTVIDRAAADRLELPALGKVWIGGGGASTPLSRLRRADTLSLGPLTIERPFFTEMDLAPFQAAVGAPIAGICGYDLLARAVIAIDLAAPSVAIHDPDTYRLEAGASWQELVIHDRHPHVRCRFEGDREGLFRLDTGAAQVSLIFHSPAVKEQDLLAGRETEPANGMFGAGGEIGARAGVLEWLELGGRRFSRTRVHFALDERGAVADPYSTGNLGGEVPRRVRDGLRLPARARGVRAARRRLTGALSISSSKNGASSRARVGSRVTWRYSGTSIATRAGAGAGAAPVAAAVSDSAAVGAAGQHRRASPASRCHGRG
ncbi:MAG: retropepsin-like aspartic protease [Planctomycetota bacterium]